MAEPGTNPKVLLVLPPGGGAPLWAADLPVVTEAGIEAAATRLHAEPVDAVIVDGRLAASPDDLVRLRGCLGNAALMVTGEGAGAAAAHGVPLPGALPDAGVATLLALLGERSRLREELRRCALERDESQGRFHAIIDGNADAIVVVDAEGLIAYANPAAGELFGRGPAALAGSPFGLPLLVDQTTEVDLIVTERPPLVAEMRVVNSDWRGEPCHIACLRDVTDRKRAEQGARQLIRERAERSAAETAARRFRFLAEAGARLASSLDTTTTLAALARLCVPEIADWVVTYQVDERGQVHRLEVAHRDPARAETVRRLREIPVDSGAGHPVLDVLASGRPLTMSHVGEAELAAIAPDPAHREVVRELGIRSCVFVPILAGERRLGALALVSASPERRLGEEELALAAALVGRAALALENARLYREAMAADQAKSDLIAVISHDLRTPLHSILGYAELLALRRGDVLGDDGNDWVGRIRKAAGHQVHLIDQLLTFGRLEAGRVQLRGGRVDAGALLDDVRGLMEPMATRAGLTLASEAHAGLSIVTDEDCLRQILVNLVTNALRYTERGGVELRAEARGDEVHLSVTDTGVGIAPEHMERVFDPFWQVDPGRKAEGTGLGLSIVRRLTHLLRGRIEVESEPGRGSRFTVVLPRR